MSELISRIKDPEKIKKLLARVKELSDLQEANETMDRMADEIVCLREENAKLLERINNLQEIVREDTKELLQYRAENEKLRAALKPFADEAEGFAPAWKDRPDPNEYAYPLYDKDDPPGFTIRDLRAAAAALKETGEDIAS